MRKLPVDVEELERLERMRDEEPGRLEPVPRIPSHEGYDWMVSFAHTVEDDTLRERSAHEWSYELTRPSPSCDSYSYNI